MNEVSAEDYEGRLTHNLRTAVPHQARTAGFKARSLTTLILLMCDAAVLFLTVENIHGPSRFLLGLVLVLAIPGWSVVGFLNLRIVALEISLTLAVSLSILMIGAQLLIATGEWHLVAFQEFVGIACLPLLLFQLFATRPSRKSK